MMRVILLAGILLAPAASAEIKLNLKHLGNKAVPVSAKQSGENRENEFGLVEEESVSATTYQSDGSQIGLRSNVELVKPGKRQLNDPAEYPGLMVEDNVPVAAKAGSGPVNKLKLKLKNLGNNSAPENSSSENNAVTDIANKSAADQSVASSSGEQNSILASIDKALGIKPVRSWEKGTLAKKEMKPGGTVPEFDLFSEKVFSYKQGSVGGSGVGGGGCGCN